MVSPVCKHRIRREADYLIVGMGTERPEGIARNIGIARTAMNRVGRNILLERVEATA